MMAKLKGVSRTPGQSVRTRRSMDHLATDATDDLNQELEGRAIFSAALPSRPAVKEGGGISRVGGLNAEAMRQELKSRDMMEGAIKGMTKGNVMRAIQELKSRNWMM